MSALSRVHDDLAANLIDRGAQLPTGEEGSRFLYNATAMGYDKTLAATLARGIDPDQPFGTDAETPLMVALHHRACLTILLRYGADPDKPDRHGKSARDRARADSDPEILRLFKAHGSP